METCQETKGKTSHVDRTFESQKDISGKSAQKSQKSVSMAQFLRQEFVGFQEVFSTFRMAQKDPLDLEVLQALSLDISRHVHANLWIKNEHR